MNSIADRRALLKLGNKPLRETQSTTIQRPESVSAIKSDVQTAACSLDTMQPSEVISRRSVVILKARTGLRRHFD